MIKPMASIPLYLSRNSIFPCLLKQLQHVKTEAVTDIVLANKELSGMQKNRYIWIPKLK